MKMQGTYRIFNFQKKFFFFGMLVCLLSSATFGTSPAFAKIASFVMDAKTGRVLHSLNPDTRNHPASLTKMMTLFMLFEAIESKKVSLNTKMKVSYTAAGTEAVRLGLKPRSTLRVEDAIYALAVRSANDVAVVIAEHLGRGKERTFAKMMTKRAKQIGMTNTTFRNASGLTHPGQLSTARDMARLGQELWKRFPEYYKYFKTKKWRYKGRTYSSTNKLMRKYDGMDGIKTGYTRKAGFNLVSSVNRGDNRLIGVVFGGNSGRERNKRMANILDKSFRKMDPQMMAAYEPPRRRSTAWGVQVGAYNTIKKARTQAKAAIKRAPSYLTGAKTKVFPLKNGRKSVYRARVVGIEKREAYRACRALKKMRQPCMVFRAKTQVALKQ